MEAWTLVAYFFAGTPALAHPNVAVAPGRSLTTIKLDIQSEDACVLAAKSITSRLHADAFCVNTFDGRVLWFTKGKQVEE